MKRSSKDDRENRIANKGRPIAASNTITFLRLGSRDSFCDAIERSFRHSDSRGHYKSTVVVEAGRRGLSGHCSHCSLDFKQYCLPTPTINPCISLKTCARGERVARLIGEGRCEAAPEDRLAGVVADTSFDSPRSKRARNSS